ncbi:MAG: response regulator transcription factor [Spirochaetales bacterium]|nr:response regulator transcription factor [Spirochaetales bacterium]
MIKILIADDQELIRDSLKILIQDSVFLVVATAGDGAEALAKAEELRPDVVLLDIRMPVMDGISCLQRLQVLFPELPVVMLTTYDDDEYIIDSLRYGAKGYLLKDISQKDLKEAIRTVVNGGSLINPEIMAKVLRIFSDLANGRGVKRENSRIPECLQKNELRIIRLIGAGHANKEIAGKLFFSEGTVRNYISGILQKLDLRDRTQIAIFAVQNGLVGLESADDE